MTNDQPALEPRPPKHSRTTPQASVPAGVEVMVNVASFAGYASLWGAFGNRADAGLVRLVQRINQSLTARQLFRSVAERWRLRTSAEENAPLSGDEAIEAAKAAAVTQGYVFNTLAVDSVKQLPDGGWIVWLTTWDEAKGSFTQVRIPAGDPLDADIFIAGW